MADGMKWKSSLFIRPLFWNPKRQLSRVKKIQEGKEDISVSSPAASETIEREEATYILEEKALRDSDARVRLEAVEKAGIIGDEKGLSFLKKALEDSDADVRLEAVKKAGMIGDEKGLSFLKKALEDSDADVRCRAVWMVKEAEGKALPILIQAFKNKNINSKTKKHIKFFIDQLKQSPPVSN